MRIIGNNPAAENAEITAVASGTLANGDAVIVNADGTVSVVQSASASVGTPVGFNGDVTAAEPSCVYDANSQKVIVTYYKTSIPRAGVAVVGTVSGTTISFGTPVEYYSARTDYNKIAYDANAQKIVIAYKSDINTSGRGTAIVGTVSGTSISFGAEVVFEATTTEEIDITYDSNSQKVVIVYRDDNNSFYGTAIVGTVSGTSISFGSPTVFDSDFNIDNTVSYDSNAQRIVVAWRDYNNFEYGTATVGTVSGTSISFGGHVVFASLQISDLSSTYDSTSQKIVLSYRDVGSTQGNAIVGTVNGTSISFGSPVVFDSTFVADNDVTYDAGVNKIVVAYRDVTNLRGKVITGTVSGSSINFDSPLFFEDTTPRVVATVYDPNAERVVIAYWDDDGSNYGKAAVFQAPFTTLTSENFIGISNGAAADTGKAKVDIGCAINGAQTGLTAGQTYYVQTNGTLGLAPADPSVIAGTAISATEIIVKG